MKKISFLFPTLLLSSFAFSQLTPIVYLIPMRDGKKIAADVYIPSGCTQCPTILIQTPYKRTNYHLGLPLGIKLNINSSNYIFVITDWRGFYGSAAAAYSGSPTTGQDGYDVVQWIAGQPWSNGKVGTWGPSALGRVQFLTAKENPPNLTCIVPQVAGPQENYADYFPNGDYRTEYAEQLDGLGFGISPILLANPVHNNLWTFIEKQNYYPDSIRVPAFMIGGWYDHTIELMLPFFNAIRTQSAPSVQNQHRLLMGPWVHGGHGAAYVGSATAGQLSYTNSAGWSDSLAMLFFDHHLRGITNNWNNSPYVQYYQMGDNLWQSSSTWPPSGLTNYKLYFHPDTSMDLTAPAASSTHSLSYNYDPTDPSPTLGGSTIRLDLNQGPYDQDSAVESRNDVLKFTSAVLVQDVVMKGNAVVHLSVSSNRKDTDFDVRLTDVYPDGRSMLVNDGTCRMRFRKGFTAADTAVMIPGTTYTCDITLPNTSITFKTGHKIRVDITSSNYPRFNRNANNGGVMYPGNNGDSLVNPVIATNTIYMDDLIKNSYISMPLTANPPLAIQESAEDEMNPDVYPNPTTGKFFVVAPEKGLQSFDVYTMLGEKIISSTPISPGEQPWAIDLSAQPKGIYFLKCKTENKGAVVKKIVVI